MKPGPLNLEDLDRPYVCVVQHFSQPTGVIHQVTLRPDKISNGLIRIGETQGDELVGWNYPENFLIINVLGVGREGIGGKWECVPLDLADEKPQGQPGEPDLAETYYGEARA